jgi:hypothetical protein
MREMYEVSYQVRHPDIQEMADFLEFLDREANDDGELSFDATLVRLVDAKPLLNFVGHIGTRILPWATYEWLHDWAELDAVYEVSALAWLVVGPVEGEQPSLDSFHEFVIRQAERLHRSGYSPESSVEQCRIAIEPVRFEFNADDDTTSAARRFAKWRSEPEEERTLEEPAWPETLEL